MTTSIDVARQLVELAGREPECEPLTHLRMQKLVYYCQGWALALLGRPLFNDRIQAWKKGPVAVELYHQLKEHVAAPLTTEAIGQPLALPKIEQDLIATVWGQFRDYSAVGLYRKTHQEPTWLNARAGLPEGAPSSAEITQEAMVSFFSSELDKQSIDGIAPREAWAGYRDVHEGRVSTQADTFARLRKKACASN